MMAFAFVLGVLAWSWSEYALHRWVGHDPKSKTDFADEHRSHHAVRGYFVASTKKVMYVGPIVLLGLGLGWCLFGACGVAFVTGFAAAYVAYEVIHRRLHTHPPRGPLGRYLRRHHFAHHFNAPQSNHGVTSPLWDFVCGTWRAPGVIRVPEKHAMVWLLDEMGDVRTTFASDYVLHRPRRKG
jgi:sterol desaturase/sphingolipid hydroxylase (fatty acid hydroxylase superfamily)